MAHPSNPKSSGSVRAAAKKAKNQKTKREKPSSNGIVWMVFLILFGYLAIQLYNQQMTLNMLRHQHQEIQEKIDFTNDKIDALDEQLSQSDSPAFIEEKARENLGMVKADEWMFIDKNAKQFDSSQ